MERMTDGVREVILYPSQTDKSKTRRYAFVEYESHRAAALARRKLVPGRIYLFGQEIEKVDWAEPENEVDEDVMSKVSILKGYPTVCVESAGDSSFVSQVRILFIRNLMLTTTEATIRKVFERLSGDEVERVKKTRDYAFVHFHTREAAQMAINNAKGLVIEGSNIEVTWSKPVDKASYNARKYLTKLLSQGEPPSLPM